MATQHKGFDEVGPWSEIKLEILKKYAAAYSTILSKTKPRFSHVYIEGFAGAGQHVSRQTGEMIPGSPINALLVTPPFCEYHLIDLSENRIRELRKAVGNQPNVFLYQGDCNKILLEKVFPKVRYEEYRRGLCILDPYGLHLDWSVIRKSGEMGTVDIFINFPIYDINLNVLKRNPDKVLPSQLKRMNAFWGDESWREAAYSQEGNLFGFEEKQPNEAIVEAFRQRLKKVAGFKRVPPPVPMRESQLGLWFTTYSLHRKLMSQLILSMIFSINTATPERINVTEFFN